MKIKSLKKCLNDNNKTVPKYIEILSKIKVLKGRHPNEKTFLNGHCPYEKVSNQGPV